MKYKLFMLLVLPIGLNANFNKFLKENSDTVAILSSALSFISLSDAEAKYIELKYATDMTTINESNIENKLSEIDGVRVPENQKREFHRQLTKTDSLRYAIVELGYRALKAAVTYKIAKNLLGK